MSKKISELPAATTVESSAVTPVVQSSTTQKATIAQIGQAITASTYAKQHALGILSLGG